MNTLSIAQPRPSILISMDASISFEVKSRLVNCDPWSVLNISGAGPRTASSDTLIRDSMLSQFVDTFRVSDLPSLEWGSLFIAFNLPSIPSPTTALPFPCLSISALLHPRQVPCVYPANKSQKSSHKKGFGLLSARYLPGWLGRIEFTYVTDWNFSSGCSPPFLTETQLPLSDSGR
jgi:hypothetical protein